MSTLPGTNWKYLEPRPKSFYRQLFVKGTRIRAEALYAWHVDGDDDTEKMTAEEIAVDFNLPLEVVQEAIAYCQSNPQEILHDHRREEALMEGTGMNVCPYNGKPKLLSAEEMARIRRL